MGTVSSITQKASMTDSEIERKKTAKIVNNANIIGDTLYVAVDKVKPIEIRVIFGGVMTEDCQSRRCNVEVENNKITKIVGIF